MGKPGFHSEHFSHREMVVSDTAARVGIDNRLPAELVPNMERLCQDFLEPIRAEFGVIRITSGYRCARLNELIGGSATSAHVLARAADLEPMDPCVTLREVVEWVSRSKLAFDQVIYEFANWVHLGIAAPGKRPRRQSLMIFRGSGYIPFDSADPRVLA